jgi:hypothetical protein
MDWLGNNHVGTPQTRNNRRAVFSVHGPCREDIRVSVVQLEGVVEREREWSPRQSREKGSSAED